MPRRARGFVLREKIGREEVSAASRWVFEKIANWAMVFRKPEIAHDYWQRILSESPNNTGVLAMQAHQFAAEGKSKKAMAQFERVLQLKPNDEGSWFNLGYLQQKEALHKEAVRSFEKSIELDEKLDRAWFGKGLSHKALAQYEEAITCFKKTNKLQPMSPHGYYELATAQHAVKDDNACEKTMRKVKEFDPKVAAQLEDETGINIGIDRWWLRAKR
jgi:tetratricopeptide (TPR) repeat protein